MLTTCKSTCENWIRNATWQKKSPQKFKKSNGCMTCQVRLPELESWAMSVGPIWYRHKMERCSYAGGSGRRQVGHSIFMSIHLCKQPEWKKWSHGVTCKRYCKLISVQCLKKEHITMPTNYKKESHQNTMQSFDRCVISMAVMQMTQSVAWFVTWSNRL